MKKRGFIAICLSLALLLSLGTFAIAAEAETVNSEASLISAIANVSAGGVINLSGEITLTDELEINNGKTFTIDLKGQSIDFAKNHFKINNSHVTINGCEGLKNLQNIFVEEAGTVGIFNGDIIMNGGFIAAASEVTVRGSIQAEDNVSVVADANMTVYGDVCASNGVDVWTGGVAIIHGDIHAEFMGVNAQANVHFWDGRVEKGERPTVIVNGNVYAGKLIFVFEGEEGMVSAVSSKGADVTVTGDVVSEKGHGVYADEGAKVYIGGSITAAKDYIILKESIENEHGEWYFEELKGWTDCDGESVNKGYRYQYSYSNIGQLDHNGVKPTTFVWVGRIAAPNLDTASGWAREAIQSGFEKGFIPFDIKNNYSNIITRQEFCRMAVKWLEYATGKDIDTLLAEKGVSRNPNAFDDTSDPDILAACALGITSGTTAPTATVPGKFTPDGQFNREQAATMVRNTVKVYGADVSGCPDAGYTDIGSAANWAVDSINFCYAYNIMTGTNTNPLTFNPQAVFTREQSIITFNNIKPDVLPKP